MNIWQESTVGDIFDVSSSKRVLQSDWKSSGVPFYRAREIVKLARDSAVDNELFISEDLYKLYSEKYGAPQEGDLMISAVGTLGACYVVQSKDRFYYKDASVLRLKAKKKICPRFFFHAFRTSEVLNQIHAGSGSTVGTYTIERAKATRIRVPPLPEQHRIAAILDKADELRIKRREALVLAESLKQSIFVEMFGDPAVNPMGWSVRSLGSIAAKFSDGPFGSNLKSEHYVEKGIRVIRLQNIGIGKFVDDDKAYISERHFESIKKHTCQPGDVLVGTLGDPNLRACILPKNIPIAINKADCVQIRVNPAEADPVFICALLNHPSTLLLASELMRGQTRVRISMGSLRSLDVPIPSVKLQNEFAIRIQQLDAVQMAQEISANNADHLFESLQHRAFQGEL